MGKYEPLTAFLRKQGRDLVECDFDQIESKMGSILPKAAQAKEWWRLDAAQTRAWRAAGYDAELLGDDQVVRFTRIAALDAG